EWYMFMGINPVGMVQKQNLLISLNAFIQYEH
ncbi:uncharacterized protein METZ01_LOCUS401787, partial [marine metagenome]